MNQTTQTCPKCQSLNTYYDGSMFWNCSECFHEWVFIENTQVPSPLETLIRDAHGQPLNEGDTVTVIKDLKIKGSSSSVKVGTKVKNIKLVEGVDGHNISCKIEGFGAMNLKSEFVKKS